MDFPNRKDWEQRLFEAKQAWVDQVDRMMAHKDSSKDSQETEVRLARGAQNIFERVAGEGGEQVRAVIDPVLKAKLQYNRQRGACMQNSGQLLERCLESLEKLKWQMQREGTW